MKLNQMENLKNMPCTLSEAYCARDFTRLANDRRSGRVCDFEIIIDYNIMVGVVLYSAMIVPIIGRNRLESGNLVQKSGRDHDH